MYVCVCKAVKASEIKAAVDRGCRTVDDLAAELAVGTGCGTCVDFARALIDEHLRDTTLAYAVEAA